MVAENAIAEYTKNLNFPVKVFLLNINKSTVETYLYLEPCQTSLMKIFYENSG